MVQKILKLSLLKAWASKINTDHNIFISKASIDGSIISIIMDDIKIMVTNKSDYISQVKIKLTAAFSLLNMRFICFYLKLKVQRD